MSFPHAMTPIFRWSDPVDMKLSGIPIVVRGFAASTTLDQAARVMARHQKHFQRITTLPGSILLSGVYAGRHWVAQIEAAPGQVRGLVSALPMNLPPKPNDGLGNTLTPWLTQNASFVFSQSSAVQGRTVTQSMHRLHQPFGSFVSAFDRHMAEAGWQPNGKHLWTRRALDGGRGRIKLFSVSAAGHDDVVLINQTN